ncbi:hypothetical protein JW848_11505 [Candidatus Bipolaricaulota bacterium]|nr:hypothetical protein [Candidatus Bipolaricaulota bacterium]
MSSDRLAPWTYPLIVALAAIVLFVNSAPLVWSLFVGLGCLAWLVYAWRTNRRTDCPKPLAGLIALLPGHLLLLFAILFTAGADRWLMIVWLLVIPWTIVYDAVGRSAYGWRGRTSISAGSYAIIWSALLFLLERAIVVGRELEGSAGAVIAACFAVFGCGFVFVGIQRHRRADRS